MHYTQILPYEQLIFKRVFGQFVDKHTGQNFELTSISKPPCNTHVNGTHLVGGFNPSETY